MKCNDTPSRTSRCASLTFLFGRTLDMVTFLVTALGKAELNALRLLKFVCTRGIGALFTVVETSLASAENFIT